MDKALDERTSYVVSAMNYLGPTDGKPQSIQARPAEGIPVQRPPRESHDMAIHDSRDAIGDLSLDVQGFAVACHESRVSDFYDKEEVKAVYYPEVERLVKKATGASKEVVFDHNVRNDPKSEADEANVRKPVQYVHNDYTVRSGSQRVRDLLEPEEAEERLKHRFAIVNVWRPIHGPVQDAPLAVCDAQSMQQDDFVATDLVYGNRTGEVYSVRHNPEHHWYYVSDMQPDEVMFLKCFDSVTDGRARFTAIRPSAIPRARPTRTRARASKPGPWSSLARTTARLNNPGWRPS